MILESPLTQTPSNQPLNSPVLPGPLGEAPPPMQQQQVSYELINNSATIIIKITTST